MIANRKEKWFETWFNSPYYHILYKNRDEKEAEYFIDNLCRFLKINEQSRILDLACGKGRHAIYLNKKGFITTGTDLSEASIKFSSQFEKKGLEFFIHDMRKPFRINYFDYIFNCFSSFGYFDTEKEHVDSIKNSSLGLKKNGVFVIDFMNINKVISTLICHEEKKTDGILFKISRELKNGYLIKTIEVTDQDKVFSFEEKVRVLTLNDFISYFKKSGLQIINLLGNYDLDTFDEKNSDRLIIIAKKE